MVTLPKAAAALSQTRPKSLLSLRLSDAGQCQMESRLTHLAYPDADETTDDELENFITEASEMVWRELPRHLKLALTQWRSMPTSIRAGIVVIDNVPVGIVPPTPVDGRRSPDKICSVSEMILIGIGRQLGQPFAFKAERGGQIVQDLTAVKGSETALTNRGSVALGWHTEHAATGLTLNPSTNVVDYLLFLGLRADHEGRAKTLVADIRDAAVLLDDSEVHLLRQPLFNVRPPFQVREALGLGNVPVGRVPLLIGPTNSMQIRAGLYGDLTEAETPEAAAAMASLKRSLSAVRRGLVAKKGRMAIVDNRVVTHARAEYKPRWDGSDRFLQRVMVTESLYGLRSWQRQSHRILEVG